MQALDEDQPGSKVLYKKLFEEDREYNQGTLTSSAFSSSSASSSSSSYAPFLFCIVRFHSQPCSCLIKDAAQHLLRFLVFMFTLYFLNPSFTLSAACLGWYHAALPGILAPSSCIKLAPPSHPPSHFITPLHTLAHLDPSDHAG